MELGFEAFFFRGALFWLSANFLRLKNDRFLKIKVELFEDTGGLFEGCAGSFLISSVFLIIPQLFLLGWRFYFHGGDFLNLSKIFKILLILFRSRRRFLIDFGEAFLRLQFWGSRGAFIDQGDIFQKSRKSHSKIVITFKSSNPLQKSKSTTPTPTPNY